MKKKLILMSLGLFSLILLNSSRNVEKVKNNSERFAQVEKWNYTFNIKFKGNYEYHGTEEWRGEPIDVYYKLDFDHQLTYSGTTKKGEMQLENIFEDEDVLDDKAERSRKMQEKIMEQMNSGNMQVTEEMKNMSKDVQKRVDAGYIVWMDSLSTHSIYKTNDHENMKYTSVGEGYCCTIVENLSYSNDISVEGGGSGALPLGITTSENEYNFNLVWSPEVEKINVEHEYNVSECNSGSDGSGKGKKAISKLKKIKNGSIKDFTSSPIDCEDLVEERDPLIDKYNVEGLKKSDEADKMEEFRKLPLPNTGMELKGSRVLKGYFIYETEEEVIPIDVHVEWVIVPAK